MKDTKMKTATHFNARRLVLTLLAIFTTMPIWAQLNGNGTETEPYLINNASDWNTFTSLINDKGEGLTAFYRLTDDITLGTSDEPLTTVVGTKDRRFSGTLDGDSHTIHIYMVRTDNYAALFGVTDGATIQNLNVDGTIITDHKFAAGFVAWADNTKKSTNIINCISSVNIHCDDIVQIVVAGKPFDCTHGGLVGQNEHGTTNFVHCMFNGSIVDSKPNKTANKCTGFIGWVNNRVTYTDCIMAGVIDVKANTSTFKNSMATFHRLDSKASCSFDDNTYYINDYSFDESCEQGKAAYKEAPENTISKVYYDVNDNPRYVPGAEIKDDVVTYDGQTLTEGTDYVIEIVNTTEDNKKIYKGINNYGGEYSMDIDPTYTLNVTIWNAEKKSGWYAIASPVEGQTFATTNHLTSKAKHNIYRYNEEDRMWEEYRNEANLFNSFENGRGYIFRTEDVNESLGFNGTVNTGDIKCKLSYNEKTDKLSGFNLIGNPYIHDIYKSVAIPNDMLISGYCYLTVDGAWVYKTDSEAIPAGTAIMVQTVADNKGDMVITMIDTDVPPTAKRSNDEIWFTVKNNDYSDVAHVEFTEGTGFNKLAHQNENVPMLYIKHNGENFASANLDDDIEAINLSFEAKTMGRYTLSLNANGNFSYLHLIDRMTGEDVDMLLEDEYSFIASGNDNADRFIVRLSYNNDNQTFENEKFAWQNGSDIIVKGEGNLQVFDMAGRMVINTMVSGEQAINDLNNGVYVFRMVNDGVKTQKIVVR